MEHSERTVTASDNQRTNERERTSALVVVIWLCAHIHITCIQQHITLCDHTITHIEKCGIYAIYDTYIEDTKSGISNDGYAHMHPCIHAKVHTAIERDGENLNESVRQWRRKQSESKTTKKEFNIVLRENHRHAHTHTVSKHCDEKRFEADWAYSFDAEQCDRMLLLFLIW